MTDNPPGETQTQHHAARQQRNKQYRHAFLTAVVARFSGILLQVVSLPIAAVKLGQADFSIYAMCVAILTMMMLSGMGVGQSLTLHMSQALATHDRRSARQMLAIALLVVGVIALTLAALLVGLIVWTPLLSVLFAQHLQGAAPPANAALFVVAVFVVMQFLAVVEAAQLAQQKQHRLNIVTSLGTLAAAVSVFWVAGVAPGLLAILAAVYLPVILFRFANVWAVLRELRPGLVDLQPAMGHLRALFADGVRFVTGTSLSHFLVHGLSVITVGLFAAPLQTASFAALMNALLLYFSALALVAIPMRGAMPEAYKRHDLQWLAAARRRLFAASVILGCVMLVALAGFGERVFALWYQGSVAPGRSLLLGAGVYCLLMGVEIASFTYLSSIGRLAAASRWLLVRSLIAAGAVFLVARQGNDHLVFWVLAAATFAFSLLPLTLMVRAVKSPAA